MKLLILCLFISSCLQEYPPEPVAVQAPVSVSTKVSPESCLLISLEGKKIFYVDHLNGKKAAGTEIKPTSSSGILSVLDSIEQRDHISLSEHEKELLVKSDANLPYPSFLAVKNAFKQKKIYKFKIVTNGE